MQIVAVLRSILFNIAISMAMGLAYKLIYGANRNGTYIAIVFFFIFSVFAAVRYSKITIFGSVLYAALSALLGILMWIFRGSLLGFLA